MLLPYTAWGAELSRDYHERSRITGVREGCVIAGILLAAGLPVLLGIEAGDRGAILAALAWSMLWLLPPLLLALLLLVPEGDPGDRSPLEVRRGLALAWRNRPFRRLLGAYFLNGIANGLPATLFLIFVADRLQARGQRRAAAAALFRRRDRRDPVLAQAQLPHRQAPRLGWCDALGLGRVRLGAAARPGRPLGVRADLRAVGHRARRRSGAAGLAPGRRGRSRLARERPAAHRPVLRVLEHDHQAVAGARGRDRLPAAGAGRLRARAAPTPSGRSRRSPRSTGSCRSRSSSWRPRWSGTSRSPRRPRPRCARGSLRPPPAERRHEGRSKAPASRRSTSASPPAATTSCTGCSSRSAPRSTRRSSTRSARRTGWACRWWWASA